MAQNFPNNRAALNNITQKAGAGPPEYEAVLADTSMPHIPRFQYSVAACGRKEVGSEQRSKALAMEAAASAFFGQSTATEGGTKRDRATMLGRPNSRAVLNELAQKRGAEVPKYEVVLADLSMPHAPRFQHSVTACGRKAIGSVQASKALAMESAASAWTAEEGFLTVFEDGGHSSDIVLKDRGTLILVDLDNLPNAIGEIDNHLGRADDHRVCEVIGYSSLAYSASKPLPGYVSHRRASSMDRDAADILMAFEVGKMLPRMKRGPERKYEDVLIISKDHFAARLNEILGDEDVASRHVCTLEDVAKVLDEMKQSSRAIVKVE